MSKPLIQYRPEHREFYTQVLKRKHQAYCELLRSPDAYGKDFWEVIVITAIDEAQKKHYEQQLTAKLDRKEIPNSCQYHVIADPPGSKIGCGGSTLYVLDYLETKYGTKLDDYRVLLIHAGGYSKRLPNHTTGGKIFCPVPFFLKHTAQCITMLEMKFMLFIDFPKKMRGGVFLTCADDIELFESAGSDFTEPGVTALAHPSTTQIGLTHGVFVFERFDKSDTGNAPRKCSRFLHKPTLETMKKTGAIVESDHGEVFVDSNFFFDRNFFKALLQFYRTNTVDCEVDAYGDFLQPLGEQAVGDYFSNTRTTGGTPSDNLVDKRTKLFETLKGSQLNVLPYIPSLFIHIGTMKEYIEHLCVNLPAFGFMSFVSSQPVHDKQFYKGTDRAEKNMISPQTCIMHSIIGDRVQVEDKTVIEYCTMLNNPTATVRIGGHSIYSQVVLPQERTNLPAGVFVHTIVVKDKDAKPGYVTVVFGIEEDLKASTAIAANTTLYKGITVTQVLSAVGLTAADVWPGKKDFSLWDAKLFPLASTPEESASLSLKLFDIIAMILNQDTVVPTLDWKNYQRISLNDAILTKDIEGQSIFRNELEKDLTFYQIQNLFHKQVCVTDWTNQLPFVMGLIELLKEGPQQAKMIAQQRLDSLLSKCEKELEVSDVLHQSRAYLSLSIFIAELLKLLPSSQLAHYEPWSKRLYRRAYIILRDILMEPFLPKSQASFPCVPYLLPNTKKFPLRTGDTSSCQSPARIILAGGWSDTPPFCLEHGGDIVNMAVQINNELPISSSATIINEPVFRLRNKDAKVVEEVPRNKLDQLFAYDLPGQPLSLHKACICFTLFPQFCIENRPPNFLDQSAELLNLFIGPTTGIELTTDVNIPQGSGLGTSSILILTAIRALKGLFGGGSSDTKVELDKEFNAVLAIEQLLTTGGGWQDQIGGGITGLKFITADPGVTPDYSIRYINLSPDHIKYYNDRLLVIWTGKTRMAKTILTNVVDNWYMRKLGVPEALFDIKSQASIMRDVFLTYSKKNPDDCEEEFGQLGKIVEKSRYLNIALDSSITNEYIDGMFSTIKDYVYGSNIIGAGSGGYIVAYLKRGVTKEQINKLVKVNYPEASVANMTLWVGEKNDKISNLD